MPAGVVESPRDEHLWNKAKGQVDEEYPDAEGDRYWKLVNGIYQHMSGNKSLAGTYGTFMKAQHKILTTWDATYDEPEPRVAPATPKKPRKPSRLGSLLSGMFGLNHDPATGTYAPKSLATQYGAFLFKARSAIPTMEELGDPDKPKGFPGLGEVDYPGASGGLGDVYTPRRHGKLLYHITSPINRASIAEHGLDFTRAPGGKSPAAGASRPPFGNHLYAPQSADDAQDMVESARTTGRDVYEVDPTSIAQQFTARRGTFSSTTPIPPSVMRRIPHPSEATTRQGPHVDLHAHRRSTSTIYHASQRNVVLLRSGLGIGFTAGSSSLAPARQGGGGGKAPRVPKLKKPRGGITIKKVRATSGVQGVDSMKAAATAVSAIARSVAGDYATHLRKGRG